MVDGQVSVNHTQAFLIFHENFSFNLGKSTLPPHLCPSYSQVELTCSTLLSYSHHLKEHKVARWGVRGHFYIQLILIDLPLILSLILGRKLINTVDVLACMSFQQRLLCSLNVQQNQKADH